MKTEKPNQHYINLFEYNDWANGKVLESFKTTGKLEEKAQLLFSHILISQTIWLERIQGKAQTFNNTMQLLGIEECAKLADQSTKDWISFLEILGDEKLSAVINYKTTKGDEYKKRITDIITQVINHSSYHRGQIALLVRNSGGIPAVTDYIAYCR